MFFKITAPKAVSMEVFVNGLDTPLRSFTEGQLAAGSVTFTETFQGIGPAAGAVSIGQRTLTIVTRYSDNSTKVMTQPFNVPLN